MKKKGRKFVSYTFYTLFACAWVDENDVSNVLITFLLCLRSPNSQLNIGPMPYITIQLRKYNRFKIKMVKYIYMYICIYNIKEIFVIFRKVGKSFGNEE